LSQFQLSALGRRLAGRIHRLHVDAALRLEEIDARAGWLHLRPGNGRHAQPVALALAEVLDHRGDLAVLLQEAPHHVVDGLELFASESGYHADELQDVMARLRLRLGSRVIMILCPARVM